MLICSGPIHYVKADEGIQQGCELRNGVQTVCNLTKGMIVADEDWMALLKLQCL